MGSPPTLRREDLAMMTNDPYAAYTAAAEALNNQDAALYRMLRAQSPALDWDGHDRRARRLEGIPYADQGPDAGLAKYLVRAPHLPALRAEDIRDCTSCGQRIYWSATRGERPTPFDVSQDGYATGINHFTTCPHAAQHRRAQHGRRKVAA